ncbi:NAD-dependent epimerase/dehydratase family protein [Flavicella sediminum]|uniref:NAD-dependent epimerase/dehydratase family protein n=1 Tax=Flavicella sediminum TaxID=2585141 RepID=UPI001122ADA7|nr:NAD-dependent epimerase/dehydratase family protein [Flavicella sediminum]
MILVTGGTGMLGAHLLFQLVAAGEKVRAIYRSEKSLAKAKKVFGYYTSEVASVFSKIDWIQADITDVPTLETAFVGVKKVYHIAALVSFDEADYLHMRAINIEGTANVVNLCVAFGVEKIAFVSSIAALAKSVSKNFIDETDEFNIETNNYSYAITKFGAEMEVWRGAQEGLDVFVVNPGVILGPGFWNENSGTLFTMVAKGSPFYTEGVTGFVGVDDVVRVLIQGMNSKVKNERFVLVSENKSFKEILFYVAESLGVSKPKVKVTSLIAGIGWRLSWLKSKLTGTVNTFSKHTAKSANNKSFYSNSKVKRTFSFEFENMETVVAGICEKYQSDKS